jgi:SpoVK/Ycf46/Vps4 family AAA+-type ATPase
LVAACRDAALLAMEEYEEAGDVDIDKSPMITMQNLVRALKKTERQITPSMLDFYASLGNQGRK